MKIITKLKRIIISCVYTRDGYQFILFISFVHIIILLISLVYFLNKERDSTCLNLTCLEYLDTFPQKSQDETRLGSGQKTVPRPDPAKVAGWVINSILLPKPDPPGGAGGSGLGWVGSRVRLGTNFWSIFTFLSNRNRERQLFVT
jgi:hypothetical protein